jgi:UDP:flavonoid glycosyltransferase YjiC (YdhE family)
MHSSCRPTVGDRPTSRSDPAMGRIAVVAGPDPGHALPALGLAAALRAAGHHVQVHSGDGHDATAAAHGLEVRRLPLLAPTRDDVDVGHRLWERAGQMAPPLATDLRRFGPDVVVVDVLTRAGGFATQLLDRPWVELVPHHLPDPAPDLPPVGLGRPLARTPWRRADDRRLYRLQSRSVALGHVHAARIAAELGLEAPRAPVLRLVATLPGLERARALWPRDAHVVGPLAIDPALPELALPQGDEPLVLVTDSTASDVHRSVATVALDALRHLDLRLVVTSSSLAARADGRIVVGRGPHGPILDRSAVAVGPGGAGLVAKATARGVPLVVVPLQGDQREAAARLRDAGVGRVVPPRRLTPRALRWAVVRQVADAGARRAARALAAEAALLGPSLAVQLVEAVLAGERPRADGPNEHLPAPPRTGVGRHASAGRTGL